VEPNPKKQLTLSAAAQANLGTGVLLLCKEALITAIQDRRLERGHLRVLAAIATFINTRTAKAWPDRASIAAMIGLSGKSVSNTLRELRNLGYLIADREPVAESGGRWLTVYTFGNIDHETIRKEITEFCRRMREQRDEGSPPTGNSEVPARGESPRPRATPGSPPTGTVPAPGAQKSPSTGDSNSMKEQREREQFAPAPPCRKNNPVPHLEEAGFVISDEHGLMIPATVVASWKTRFPAIPDLEAQMQKLASFILAGGTKHAGWTCPEAWMAGHLAEDNESAADRARITEARIASVRRSQPTKTFAR